MVMILSGQKLVRDMCKFMTSLIHCNQIKQMTLHTIGVMNTQTICEMDQWSQQNLFNIWTRKFSNKHIFDVVIS